MIVYRICLAKWSKKLSASGYPARWNSKGKYVIYTASSRALACLENVVHRSGEGLNDNFKVMLIEIPKKVKIEEVKIDDLPDNWYEFEFYFDCQQIGDEWMSNSKTAVLKVPSSIITKEFNFLVNVNHIDFKHIKLVGIEKFAFDPRIKN